MDRRTLRMTTFVSIYDIGWKYNEIGREIHGYENSLRYRGLGALIVVQRERYLGLISD